jgi:hypothetical protein
MTHRTSAAARALGAALLVLTVGCQRDTAQGAAASSSAPAPPLPAPSASLRPAPSAPPTPPAQPLQLFRFSFTSEVKNREPADFLEAAEPGQRVYAHMAFKNSNPEPRVVHLVFRVNGERRTSLDLKVTPSQSYRTWAFNTLKDQDREGHLTLEVTDETGQTLLNERLPIKPARKTSKTRGTHAAPR